MSLSFEAYWPAILLVTVVFLWWMRGETTTSLSSSHLNILTFIRSFAVAFLVLALMRPLLYRPTKAISAVFALDVSKSISPEFLDAAIQWARDAVELGKPQHARFIGFGASSAVVETADELGTLPVHEAGPFVPNSKASEKQPLRSIDQSGTNIALAVRQAMTSFASNHLKRLVLITDGHETEGEIEEVIPELQNLGIRVFTVPAAVRGNNDSWVESINVPSAVRSKEMIEVSVLVFSRIANDATVALDISESKVASKEIELEPGFTKVSFEVRLPNEGSVALQASVDVVGDPYPVNNSLDRTVSVGPAPHVLYVEGHMPSAHYLQNALVSEGLDVSVRSQSNLQSVSWSDFDAVILSDVSIESLTERTQRAIERYVRDEEGGFIFASGESSYGENGYSDTIIERVLPVNFRLEEKWKDLSLIIVLDKSYSMYGRKIALAKEATKAALDLLEDSHRFGVVTFDWNPYTTIPLQLASNKDWIKEGISQIQASAQTNIYPALERAFEQLVESPSKVKHVILLSDGKTYPDDYEDLVEKMTEEEITVSTVAVGEEADQELLADIAEWGDGRSYFIKDAERVQQIFIEETQIALETTLIEEQFSPLVKQDIKALRGVDFESVPDLRGYVSTLAKDTAEVVLEAQEEDPLLARWHYGIGRSVMFTSDVKNRWAAEWLEWDGYGKFWAQLVRETLRRNHGAEIDFNVERRGDNARIELSVVDKEGKYPKQLTPILTVTDPGKTQKPLPMRQTAPGIYQASMSVSHAEGEPWRFDLDEDTFSAEELTGAGKSLDLFYSYPDEYRFYPPDRTRLESISSVTGGVFQPEKEDVFTDFNESELVPTELWPFLVSLALLLYLLDLALRRAPWILERLEAGREQGGVNSFLNSDVVN